jgi:hypothetical protein
VSTIHGHQEDDSELQEERALLEQVILTLERIAHGSATPGPAAQVAGSVKREATRQTSRLEIVSGRSQGAHSERMNA